MGQLFTASILEGSHFTPSLDTICPKKVTSCLNRTHLEGFSLRLAPYSLIQINTLLRFEREVLISWPKTITPSRYHKHLCQLKCPNTLSIKRRKDEGPFDKPNGSTLNWNNPLCVANAVFRLYQGCILICQNPLARSNVLNHLLLVRVSKVSPIRGKGYASSRAIWFNFLKST